MFRHTTLVILTLSATMFGCRTPVRVPPVAGTPTHLLESQAGLKAMNEATPDGYQRAVAHFRRAVDLRPATCDYKLQFAHASLLFALEQELNEEDFNPARNQAIQAATCATPDS